ncbi:pyridoxamine 5'-phosphate oxidase family protein [Halobacterium yunchengense]|uniref:pyridoxamine 5'-phosphate oxidase family protein n=1 Tax=Halobacterium yunchengense TaxID=3108497 RepID=UPI00300A889C
MEHAEYVYTAGLGDDEVAERLAAADHCVLALADGGDAYAVPVSCHWDGDALLLRLSEHGDAAKLEYVDTTATATVVVYDVADGADAWSVVLRGRLVERETPDEATLNEWFGPFRLFDEAVEDVAFRVLALEPAATTGRETV